MSNQLVKKNPAEGYQNVFPKTWIDAIKDKESGVSLQEILQGFNMYFLSYNGSRALTRCKVPSILRKEGLWITYVLYDHTVVTEWYNSDQIDDNSWSMDSNWRVASNNLVGDISVSSDGYWVINGEKTEAKAQGEQGVTPLLRVGANNKLQVSYNEGKAWKDISDYIVPRFRWNQGTDTSAGNVQISMDLGKTWANLSNEITNNLRISRYIGINESLPTSGVAEGTIYMKGPYYDESDTSNANPIYRMWVYAWKDNTLAWQDNGEFTSISIGVVQERGTSTTKVMSQDTVTRELTKLEDEVNQLGQTINGGSMVGYIEEIWTAKGYMQTQDAVIGSVFNPVIETDSSSRAYIIKVKAGETYKINGLGNTSAVNLVVIIDSNNIVLDKYMGDSRINAYIANIKQDGILCVNLYSYNSATDGVYFARKNSGLNKDVENILGEQVPQNINIAPKGNGAIRTDTVVIDSAFTPEIIDAAGCVYFEFSAKKGDYINIKGSGDTELVSLYVRCNTQGIVKEKYTGNLLGCNGYIRVEEDSNFYVNMLDYNATTMGVTIHRYEYIGGIEEKIDGVNINVIENIVPNYWSQGYVDTSNAVIGNKFYTNHINQTSGIVGFIIDVKVGERYEIKGAGDTELVSLYVLCDDLDIVLNKFIGNARTTPILINIQKNGTLYINIIGYDASVDYIHKIKPTTIGGYKAYYESENNLKWKEKNIVCFGDSLTEFNESQRTKKRYTDYIAEKTGASVYNVGIGGTRIAQRGVPTSSPQSSTEAYAGLDICNMVKAWATRDFAIVDACAEYLKNNTGDDNTGIIDVLKSSHFENTDIVTIFAGTNDYTGDSAIGSSTDKDDGTDNGNMWGALKYIIKEILTANPKIHIYVFSPIVRYIGNIQEENWSDNYTRGDGKHLYDIADIISDISKYKHIPCCNWYWTLGWNQNNFALYFMNAFGVVDDTHPVNGFGYIADKMIGFLKSNGE